jgi:photosystem II stability/assembly factor-like uncharacterized protein
MKFVNNRKNKVFRYLLIISIFSNAFACKKKELEISYNEFSTPVSTRINKTFWQDPLNGFFCGGEKGSSGYIYHTTDGGNTWQNVYTNSNKSLYDVYFVDANTGYCCGEELLLLITNDGGLTWNEFNYPIEAPEYEIVTLRNITGNQNFVLFSGGDNFNQGVSFRFINGGFPWVFYRYDAELRTAIAFDIHNYIACGYGLTFQSKDTGITFNPLPATEDFFTGSSVINNTAYACGYNGGIYKIGNSETNWTKILDANKIFKKQRVHFNGICMTDNNNGYAVGHDGAIIKTTNGTEWKRCSALGETNLLSIANNKGGKLIISSSNGKLYAIQY